jgi:phenylpropionate dioxygenase-like ring-hydroxylating dioxygenase large terminal subunit
MESGSYSVAFPRRWWNPVARSSELRRRPLAVMLMDTPLVVFRCAGAPAVLVDRCAHRNYPLSLGRVGGDGALECGYHGWSYGGGGQCVRVPGLCGATTPSADTRRVAAHADAGWGRGARPVGRRSRWRGLT